MARFRMILEYEGTRYSGWQVQKNARTVQGELLRALHAVLKTEKIELYGSGRTDAGVHALMQVAHLDAETMLAPEIIRMKVNDELPADINVIEVEKAEEPFHARHDAVSRSYLYQISRRRTALGKRYVWWIKDPLNVSAMKRAAAHLTGMHDFRAFAESGQEDGSTKVLIDRIEIAEHGGLILVRVVGSHFLWKLVRRIVGVLAEVGRGALDADTVPSLLKGSSDLPARLTAPPSGLFLERVLYGHERDDRPLVPVMEISPPPLHRAHQGARPSGATGKRR